VGTVTTLFVAVNVALLYVLPVSAIAGTPLALTLATGQVIGAGGAGLIAGLVVIATLGSLAGCVLSDPRVFFAMARDRHFFARIGVVHPVRRTPVFAIALHALLASVYVGVRDFEQLAATFVLGFMPFSALVAVAVWRLRHTRPDLARPFRAPAVPLLASFWVAVAGLLILNALIETPTVAVVNVLITLSGVPVFFVWRRFRNRGELPRGIP
jgi:APA family basic amino acid/polyamine antiporter